MDTEKEKIHGRTLDDVMRILPGLDQEIARKYWDVLHLHITSVQKASDKVGVPRTLSRVHDESKLGPLEFEAYALHFVGGGAPEIFAKAWLHHIHHNPHHWQYWIFPDGFTLSGSESERGVMPMPQVYALEMIADWMGASVAYTGNDDMSTWLMGHMASVRVHTTTASFLRRKLHELGYGEIVYSHLFAHELERDDSASEE